MPCGYELKLIALVHLLFYQLYLAYTDAPSEIPMDNGAFTCQKMIEYIYKHFNEESTLDDISTVGNVSLSQCAKLFKKHAKLSPMSLLNKHRLEIGLKLLLTTSQNVAEIANFCGFFDQSYFNRVFLREYGCTPLAYRKSGRVES